MCIAASNPTDLPALPLLYSFYIILRWKRRLSCPWLIFYESHPFYPTEMSVSSVCPPSRFCRSRILHEVNSFKMSKSSKLSLLRTLLFITNLLEWVFYSDFLFFLFHFNAIIYECSTIILLKRFSSTDEWPFVKS